MKSILRFNKSMKLQSAMEYLITYGWAIIILAIALVALFVLGVFNSSSATGQICKINQNFDCISYYMNTTGVLVITLTQTSSTYINITSIGCSSDQNNQHLVQYTKPSQQPYIPYDSAYSLTLQCYTATGKPSLSLGTAFSGSIYINYVNDVTGFPGSAQGSFVIKPSTVNAIVLNSGSLGYVPVTLTNTQSTSTVSGLQQMINFNPSTYSQYLNKNLSNLEFTTGPNATGSILPAWIESGASNTASNAVVWVNLGSTLISSSSTHYMSVNVINSQSTATGTNFQQMIYFNPSSYSSYEASDLGNIRFYAGSTELYSWCESGCTSTSSNAIFWVNTGSLSISADSYAIINLTFEPTSTEYDGTYAGEAPQLSSTYGQYDNGGNVFPFYDNFAGTSINTVKWSVQQGTAVVSNGLDGITNGGSPVSILSSSTYNPQNEVLDLDANVMNFAGNLYHGFGIYNPNAGITESWIADFGYYYLDNYNGAGNSISFNPTYPTLSASTNYVFSNWETSTATYAAVNYGPSISNPNDFRALTSAYIGLKQFSTSDALNIQWIRLRTTPPNSVMPTFQLSSVKPFGSAQDTATIYMDFLTTSAPVVTGHTGYAPQLYCSSGCMQSSYGQYDNGVNVFNLYDNFKGTTLNTNNWYTDTSGCGGSTPTINNGLTITPTNSVRSNNEFYPGNVIDTYAQIESIGTYPGGGCYLDGVGFDNNQQYTTGYTAPGGDAYGYIEYPDTPTYANLPNQPTSSSNYYIWSSIWSTNGFFLSTYNYGTGGYVQGGAPVTTNEQIWIAAQSNSDSQVKIYWIRSRYYPPNGVMPLVSLGSFIR